MLPIVSYEQLRGVVNCMGALFFTVLSGITFVLLQVNNSNLRAYGVIFTSFIMLLHSEGLILLPFVV